jgi:hypothetical protein
LKGKILAGFVLIFFAISLVGYYSFESLTRLVSTVEEKSRPNPKNLQMKEILFDLSNAESSVRAYTITLDANYLIPYYETATTIERKLSDLYELCHDDEHEIIWLDSLSDLIDHKYFVMNDLIVMKQDDKRADILNQVLENIDRYDRALLDLELIDRSDNRDDLKVLPDVPPFETSQVDDEIKNKRPNIFQRIFGTRNKERESSEIAAVGSASDSTSLPQITLAERNLSTAKPKGSKELDAFKEKLVSAVAQMRQNEKSSVESMMAREIELFELDNEIMTRIRSLMNKFEERERQISLEQSQSAEIMTQMTKNRIYWIGGGSLALFTILVIIIIRDVSVNNQTRRKLQDAKDEAEKLAKVKEEFLSNISHEIRTPINSILGFARQLEKTSMDTRQKAYLNVLSKSSEHLLALINDVLDYSKLESGNVSLEEIGFKPLVCIEEVKEALQPFAESKFLKLEIGVDNVPEILIGDPVRYRQILINLVNNAIKFTKSGTITIKVSVNIGANRCKLKTSIIDTGIGIPPSKIFAIFKTFNQVDNSTAREYGGSGLGLSICKKLVDAQNGKIWATSNVGQGSAFNFEIIYPIGTEKDLPETGKQLTPAKGIIKEKIILVVDDEKYNLLLFRTILENNNAKVITTDRPHDVQQILKEKPVDLILMDIQMPGLDGITLTKKIRAESKSTIPILALTATTNNTERAKCVEAGFDGFLVKPIEESILINSIANFIGWDQLEIQTKGVADTNELDLNNLFEIGNNDLDFVYNMLVLFINNFSNGMKELKEKLNEGNKQDLASVAHKMVPPCRHLGLNDIVKILKSIEGAGRNEMEITELNLHIKNLEKDGKKIIQQLESEVERIKPHKIKS